MTVLSTANALSELFEHSKDFLTTEKLEWFGNLTTPAQTELINVTKSLDNLAMTYGDKDQSLPSREDLSAILFGLSDQVANIAALMSIAEEASYLAGERKAAKAKTPGNKKPA